MANRLEVEIGAEIKELQKKLADAQKNLSSFDKKAASNMGKFSKSTKTATKDLKKFDKGAANGSSAMLAFSRTVQDAPFGMMGISNNITNLTEQFGALKKRTGSAGGALKAMLKDLSGFGGITLAISLATSAWLMFGDKIVGSKDKVKSLKEEQDKLNDSLENYVLGLETVEQANLKGQQSATKELTRLRLLKSQVENGTLSLNKRKGAIEELRKKYPEYLKNMSDEKLLNGGLETTYNTLTTSILKRAKATASMNQIVKNSEQLLTIESQLAAVSDEKSKAEQLYNRIIKVNEKRTASYRGASVDGTQRESVALTKLNKLKEAENKLIAQKQNLELSNIDLEQNVDSTGGIADAIVPANTSEKIRERVEAVGVGLSDSLNGIQDVINEKPLQIISDNTLSDFEIKAMLLKAKLQQLSESVTQIVEGQLRNAFRGIGQAIGDSMAGAGNLANNLGSALLGAVGGLLTQLGSMAIAVGVSLKAIKLALKSLNPAVAIGAGVALIALGSFFTSKSSQIGDSVGGGGGNTSNAGSSSSSSGSTSFSGGASASNSGGTYVFEIAGTKLVGVLKNTLDRNKNLGGTLSIT